jgi:exosortase
MKRNKRRQHVLRSPDDPPILPMKESAGAPVANETLARSATSPLRAETLSASAFALALAGFLLCAAALVWAYLPTLTSLVEIWEREPDYSHGWFVLPITLYLLWSSRESMPSPRLGWYWGGVLLLLAIVLLRVFARWAYFDFVDGWTLPLSILGLAWICFGGRWVWWATPALLFLFFMIPLPYRIENELSRPLQWIATNASCYSLQLFGRPAIAEGTTILLGEHQLEVERACSGLRIFMGVFALAYAYAYLAKRVWWERAVLILAAIPIALAANAIRIIATAMLYEWFDTPASRQIIHDWAGYFMILVAALLFAGTLLYMRLLVPDGEAMDRASLQRV